MVDTEVCATSCKFCSFELSPIVCEDPLGYTELVYDTLQELDRCILSDVHYWHSFHQLGDCVNSNE
jgi:hypothetical protein